MNEALENITKNQNLEVSQHYLTSSHTTRSPSAILTEAKMAAQSLKDVISQKKKKVVFNGEQYLEFEDWQTIGRFYNVTSKIVSTNFVQYGAVQGFEAYAVAIDLNSGQEISGANAMCLNDESQWSTRPQYEWVDSVKTKIGDEPVPLFQLRSMAQTRACAKVLRNVLAWVAVLAGYKPTPAEELQDNSNIQSKSEIGNSTIQQPQRKSASQQTGPDCISEAQRKRLYAIWKGASLEDDVVSQHLTQNYGISTTSEIKKSDYGEIVLWVQSQSKEQGVAQ
jgi:hypothetical protein